MAKKTQGTDTKQHDIAAPPENMTLDKSIVRYIIRALLLIILFAWALINLDAVMKFLGKVISLFSPFLIGGGIAFLINVVLNPLERCWNKVCKKSPCKAGKTRLPHFKCCSCVWDFVCRSVYDDSESAGIRRRVYSEHSVLC